MTKIKLVVVLLLLVLGTTNNNAYSQKGGSASPQALGICYPDCYPPDAFLPGPMITLTLPGGCQVLVEWYSRVACGTWFDYQITNIHFLTPECDTMSVADITNQTMIALLIANPSNFPPKKAGQPCSTNWRVSRASCWRFDEESLFSPSGKVTPCDANICCLQYFTVCIDENGNRIVTKTGAEAPEACPPQTRPDETATCAFICN